MAESSTSTFGRYELRGTLGRGGFAQVYRAWDTALQREVALKALLPHLADDESIRQRFLGEARAMARLRHPDIVTVYDVGEVNGQPYFTMELVEGRSLSSMFQTGGRADPGWLIQMLRSVCLALDYLHAQGFVHRDIKPANIMVDNDGRVLLMDFGIARAMNESGNTLTGVSLGTPEYMAPEQVLGQPVGTAADIYALAVLTYRLLAGRPPFEGSTAGVLLGHASQDPPPLRDVRPGLPEPVYTAIDAALTKDPAVRPATAMAFLDLLRGRSDDRPTPRETPTVWLQPDQGATEFVPTDRGTNRLTPAVRSTAGAAPRRGLSPLLLTVAIVAVVVAAAGGAYAAFGRGGKSAGPSNSAAAGSATTTQTATATAVIAQGGDPSQTAAAGATTRAAPTATRNATTPATRTAPTTPPTRAPTQPPVQPPTRQPTVVTTVVRPPPVVPSGSSGGASGPAVVVSKQYGAALHSAPSSDAQVITVLPCGDSLTLIEEQTGWYHVSTSGMSGWIGGARAVRGGTAVDCTGAVTYQVGDSAVTHVDSGCLSLRSAPARDASFSQCVANGTVYRVTGGPIEANGEDWLPVSNPSLGSGWVLAQFLQPQR